MIHCAWFTGSLDFLGPLIYRALFLSSNGLPNQGFTVKQWLKLSHKDSYAKNNTHRGKSDRFCINYLTLNCHRSLLESSIWKCQGQIGSTWVQRFPIMMNFTLKLFLSLSLFLPLCLLPCLPAFPLPPSLPASLSLCLWRYFPTKPAIFLERTTPGINWQTKPLLATIASITRQHKNMCATCTMKPQFTRPHGGRDYTQ